MKPIEFEHQIIQLEDKLKRFALSLISQPDEANDLVQDTYYKAWANRAKFKGDSNLKAWMFTIMKNTFINKYRKKQKERAYWDNNAKDHLMNHQEDSTSIRPDSDYSIIEINRKIEELPNKFRIPFKMFLSGYTYEEISDSLNLKMGTTKSRLFFTRKKLAEKLEGY
ncbi:MAG: sigma-70 family RNA polymerase sigma factor [Bacteroidota bacterium]